MKPGLKHRLSPVTHACILNTYLILTRCHQPTVVFCKSDTRRIAVECCERKGATILMLNRFFAIFHCFGNSISISAISVKRLLAVMADPVIPLLIRGTWFIRVYINITTWANEVYYVSRDFNTFLFGIEFVFLPLLATKIFIVV